jgi:hypothetical protein
MQCGNEEPTICADMIVVGDIVWTGDKLTEPHPLSVDRVLAATLAASPESALRAPGPTVSACGADIMDGLTMCPTIAAMTAEASPIAGASVLPSVEAVARALPNVTPGVDGALQPSAVTSTEGGSSGARDYRYLVVDNVVILVRTSFGEASASDREFLTRLETALKAQEATSGN